MQKEKKSQEEVKRDLEASRIRFERLSNEMGLQDYGRGVEDGVKNIYWFDMQANVVKKQIGEVLIDICTIRGNQPQGALAFLNQDSLNIALFGE